MKNQPIRIIIEKDGYPNWLQFLTDINSSKDKNLL